MFWQILLIFGEIILYGVKRKQPERKLMFQQLVATTVDDNTLS